jgi:hypothetical protein
MIAEAAGTGIYMSDNRAFPNFKILIAEKL